MNHAFALVFIFCLSGLAFPQDAEAFRRPITQVPVSQRLKTFGEAHDEHFTGKTLKALIWNIKKTQEESWRLEFLRLSSDQDLLVLQEGITSSRFQSILSFFPHFEFAMGTSFLSFGSPTGVMNASTVRGSHLVTHTRDREPIVNTPKATLYSRYLLPETRQYLLVVNVHGINLESYRAFRRHLKQMLAVIDQHSGPVLWAGDFNTRTKARTALLLKLTQERGFAEVKFENGHRRMVWLGTRNYLDHAFVRGLAYTRAWVDPLVRGSDHKPLFVELELESAQTKF